MMFAWGTPNPDFFSDMEEVERLQWLDSIRQSFGDRTADLMVANLGLDVEALRASGADPEYIAKITHCTNLSQARNQAHQMIEEIGGVLGDRASLLVEWMLGKTEPPPPCWIAPPHLRGRPSWPACPALSPDLVWKLFRSFWHEIVHRGMEIGINEPFWIYGVNDFTYDQALHLVQNMWLAFRQVTGLDFTDPQQSALIKSWLGALSPRESNRETASDWHRGSEQERKDRLQHYIDYGGPSRKLMEEQGQKLGPVPDGESHVYGEYRFCAVVDWGNPDARTD